MSNIDLNGFEPDVRVIIISNAIGGSLSGWTIR